MSSKRGRGRPSDYKAYVNHYNAIKKQMKKHGLDMAEKKMNKLEWKTMREALINERKEQIEKGERKTLGNINRDLAKMQQYQYSKAQAKAWRKQIKEEVGEDVTLAAIRAGKYGVNWTAISAREADLRSQGLDLALVRHIIAQEYFGSE